MILVLGKALDIMELLGRNPNREIALGEIAHTLHMDRGTCSNIIKTLASRGYVQQTGPRQGYKMGYMIYNLASSSVNNDELTKIAREDVERLGKKINECVLLSVIRNDKRVVLFRADPDRDIFVKAFIDKGVYGANSGRVILANYTPSHMEKFIIRKGLPTIDEWPEIYQSDNVKGELMNILSSIRMSGYSIMTDMNDITGIAAPIFRDGHVAGSIGTYVPNFRLTSTSAILEDVLNCAREINHKIALTDGVKQCSV